MGQCGGPTRRVANGKIVGVERLGPEIDRLSGALFDAGVTCTGRLVEGVNAGVSLIRWARRPFAMSRVRRDCGHTSAGHTVAPFYVANGATRWNSSSSGDEEG